MPTRVLCVSCPLTQVGWLCLSLLATRPASWPCASWFTLLTVYVHVQVRLFIIFHDAGHDNYLPSPLANKAVGLLCNFLNMVAFSFWARGHNHHHRHR